MELNLNTMNSTWHIAAHIHTLPTYPPLCTAAIGVCMCVGSGFVDACVERWLFLSQKTQGIELFMKCNQACVKGFLFAPHSSSLVHVCLFVCLEVSTPATAGSWLWYIYCLYRCWHAVTRHAVNSAFSNGYGRSAHTPQTQPQNAAQKNISRSRGSRSGG